MNAATVRRSGSVEAGCPRPRDAREGAKARPATRAARVAHYVNLDGSTVTRQVSALQRDGLITRGPDPEDGPGTVVSPTAAGLQRMAAVRAARTRLYGDILEDWDAEDRDTLARLLRRLNEELSARNRRR